MRKFLGVSQSYALALPDPVLTLASVPVTWSDPGFLYPFHPYMTDRSPYLPTDSSPLYGSLLATSVTWLLYGDLVLVGAWMPLGVPGEAQCLRNSTACNRSVNTRHHILKLDHGLALYGEQCR